MALPLLFSFPFSPWLPFGKIMKLVGAVVVMPAALLSLPPPLIALPILTYWKGKKHTMPPLSPSLLSFPPHYITSKSYPHSPVISFLFSGPTTSPPKKHTLWVPAFLSLATQSSLLPFQLLAPVVCRPSKKKKKSWTGWCQPLSFV